MNNRNYNIYFHTHTISGIIISAILYVIFFAGSFSFFRHEIENWQHNSSQKTEKVDFNRITDSLDKEYGLYSREVSYGISPNSPNLFVSVSDSKDTTVEKKGSYFYLDINKNIKTDYESAGGFGEFLYELHFLNQVNDIADFGFSLGWYLSGFVAFLFLFALITGLLLHWDKIVSNFYIFRPWEKLKTVWTDLHTALGVITYPFLLVFAVTGSYYNISDIFSTPIEKIAYKGDTDALYADLGYGDGPRLEMTNKKMMEKVDVPYFINTTKEKFPKAEISEIKLSNYGDESMQVTMQLAALRSDKFTSQGEVVYNAGSKKLVSFKDPMAKSSYTESVRSVMDSLHFGNYGGYVSKLCNFILGICGCIVIISGVLIWLTARNKKNIPEKKRRFNEWLVNIYLSISLSMFPVTAATFIFIKLNPEAGKHQIGAFYFWGWFIVSILLIIRRNNFKTNRDCLWTGAAIGLLIPIVNGIKTKSWVWDNYRAGYSDLVLVDLFWLLVAICAFICLALVFKNQKNKLKTSASPVAPILK